MDAGVHSGGDDRVLGAPGGRWRTVLRCMVACGWVASCCALFLSLLARPDDPMAQKALLPVAHHMVGPEDQADGDVWYQAIFMNKLAPLAAFAHANGQDRAGAEVVPAGGRTPGYLPTDDPIITRGPYGGRPGSTPLPR